MPTLGRTDLTAVRGLAPPPVPQGLALNSVTYDQTHYAATMPLNLGHVSTSGSYTANSGSIGPMVRQSIAEWYPRRFPNSYTQSFDFFNAPTGNRTKRSVRKGTANPLEGWGLGPTRAPRKANVLPEDLERREYQRVDPTFVTQADMRAYIDDMWRGFAAHKDPRGGTVNWDYKKEAKQLQKERLDEAAKTKAQDQAADELANLMAGFGIDVPEAMDAMTLQPGPTDAEDAKRQKAEWEASAKEWKARLQAEKAAYDAQLRQMETATGMEVDVPAYRPSPEILNEIFAAMYQSRRADAYLENDTRNRMELDQYDQAVDELALADYRAYLGTFNDATVLDEAMDAINRRDRTSANARNGGVPSGGASVPAAMPTDRPPAQVPAAEQVRDETPQDMEVDGPVTPEPRRSLRAVQGPAGALGPNGPMSSGAPQSALSAAVRNNEAQIVYNISNVSNDVYNVQGDYINTNSTVGLPAPDPAGRPNKAPTKTPMAANMPEAQRGGASGGASKGRSKTPAADGPVPPVEQPPRPDVAMGEAESPAPAAGPPGPVEGPVPPPGPPPEQAVGPVPQPEAPSPAPVPDQAPAPTPDPAPVAEQSGQTARPAPSSRPPGPASRGPVPSFNLPMPVAPPAPPVASEPEPQATVPEGVSFAPGSVLTRDEAPARERRARVTEQRRGFFAPGQVRTPGQSQITRDRQRAREAAMNKARGITTTDEMETS